jgi:hypothetical protein
VIWEYFSSISGLLGTLIALTMSTYAFFTYRSASLRYRQHEARMPEATRFENLTHMIARHQEMLERLQEEASRAQQTIGEALAARGEHDRLQEKSETLQRDLDNLRQLYAERKHDAEREFRANSSQLQSDFDALEDKLRQQQKSLELSVSDARQSVDRDIEKTQHAWDRKKEALETAEYSRIQALRQSLTNSKAAIEGEIEQIEREHSIKKSDMERENESVIADLQRDFDSKKLRMNSAFEQQKAEFISQLETLKLQVTKAENESNRLEILQGQLAEVVETLTNSRSELKIEVDGLRSEKQSIEKALPQLQAIWKRLSEQTGGGTESERTAELWQPVFQAAELENSFSEEEGLQDIQTYIKSCGLRYSERTLYSFHTSLKVSETSPLVVLAGISGTGKSELPRRYAEALGINFLPLAVQPRWDSPQDMFGFFNYLENRFRATELGRSLVQMDPYFDESERGWPGKLPKSYVNLSDQVLMVLLDEMNLARVEYYFSEFLSRLEYRPGVIKTDPESRRKAELPLEIGRSGLGSPTMSIFVPTNVLFVGTMNEDETTQTLSDKVVDRSNVIRFGCPKNLEVSQTAEPLPPAGYRLSSDTWAEWQFQDDKVPVDRDQLEQWIERLKQAMLAAKRPFAHRTSRAIHSYVAYYPRIHENWFKHAVADQIEQKLMPKFRGLDPSESDVGESLDKIRDIARELEDSELVMAIQASRDGHQFSWSGIDRLAAGEAAP